MSTTGELRQLSLLAGGRGGVTVVRPASEFFGTLESNRPKTRTSLAGSLPLVRGGQRRRPRWGAADRQATRALASYVRDGFVAGDVALAICGRTVPWASRLCSRCGRPSHRRCGSSFHGLYKGRMAGSGGRAWRLAIVDEIAADVASVRPLDSRRRSFGSGGYSWSTTHTLHPDAAWTGLWRAPARSPAAAVWKVAGRHAEPVRRLPASTRGGESGGAPGILSGVRGGRAVARGWRPEPAGRGRERRASMRRRRRTGGPATEVKGRRVLVKSPAAWGRDRVGKRAVGKR